MLIVGNFWSNNKSSLIWIFWIDTLIAEVPTNTDLTLPRFKGQRLVEKAIFSKLVAMGYEREEGGRVEDLCKT